MPDQASLFRRRNEIAKAKMTSDSGKAMPRSIDVRMSPPAAGLRAMLGKVKTVVQMIAIPFLLYHGTLFGLIDTQFWGTVLIIVSAVLTIWSMVYYLQKALPEIRARVR